MTVTPIYAGLLALVFLTLSVAVIRHRRGARISLGDAGDARLQQLSRGHANCAEYAGFGLILLALAELQGTLPALALHGLGLLLLVGRVLHAGAFLSARMQFGWRVAGMILTLSMLALGAAGLLVGSLL